MSTLHYDSILTAVDSNVVNRSVFYAAGEHLPERGVRMAERGYTLMDDTRILLLVMVLLLMVAFATYFSRSSMYHQARVFFSTKRHFSTIDSMHRKLWAFNFFLLLCVSAISVSLVWFDWLAERYQFSTTMGIPYWLLFLAFIIFMLYVYLRAWLYAVVNWTFFDRESSSNWQASYFLLTSMMAYLIFPVSLLGLLATISREFVIWGYVFAVVLYELLLIFKLFVNFRAKKYACFLFFLYFCSVELVPAFILWHVLRGFTDIFIEANVLY